MTCTLLCTSLRLWSSASPRRTHENWGIVCQITSHPVSLRTRACPCLGRECQRVRLPPRICLCFQSVLPACLRSQNMDTAVCLKLHARVSALPPRACLSLSIPVPGCLPPPTCAALFVNLYASVSDCRHMHGYVLSIRARARLPAGNGHYHVSSSCMPARRPGRTGMATRLLCTAGCKNF